MPQSTCSYCEEKQRSHKSEQWLYYKATVTTTHQGLRKLRNPQVNDDSKNAGSQVTGSD